MQNNTFYAKEDFAENNIKIGLATPRFTGSLDLSSYSSSFSSFWHLCGMDPLSNLL